MKIRPVGGELFHADGQTQIDGRTDGPTDRQICTTKLIVSFRNFANALKENVDCQWKLRYVIEPNLLGSLLSLLEFEGQH